ncbi:hypothetical protein TSOC_000894 [Tetrabaena socialis]|uniref:RING-type domain-containing protein n=1 Tax=Tetrabaena socialis TaxID=47790 RepID=A0A2J8AI69_9CHLO|nr:hypothetical protein TSOC_000894 [Tetrabaena socialis]|eukprot:PNH12212.1 hypothetical protein TSOC_000894 [Tetrabaena socialis]
MLLSHSLSQSLALELSALRSQSLRELGRVGTYHGSVGGAAQRFGDELAFESDWMAVIALAAASTGPPMMLSAGEAIASLEEALSRLSDGGLEDQDRCLRTELINRCLLSSLYESESVPATPGACCGAAARLNGCSAADVMAPATKAKGRTEESFGRWRAFNELLAAAGRSIPDECPICADEFTPQQACAVLGCGHSFHRSCCDTWLGTRMFMTGEFRAECPLCKQLDSSLKPTPAAIQALADYKRSCEEGGGSGSDTDDLEGSGSGSGDESDGTHTHGDVE